MVRTIIAKLLLCVRSIEPRIPPQTLYGFHGQVDFAGAAIVASAAMLTAPGDPPPPRAVAHSAAPRCGAQPNSIGYGLLRPGTRRAGRVAGAARQRRRTPPPPSPGPSPPPRPI